MPGQFNLLGSDADESEADQQRVSPICFSPISN